ncbi:hypothetical protein GmHk_14G040829 [Glycine max]|nr:hypothetical protein GmHk_14G040829 [Glycine max]
MRAGCGRSLGVERSVIIHHSLADSWVWEPCPTGRYTSKSAYLLLSCDSPLQYSTNIFVVLWRLKIPHKTSFLIWKILRNRLPTKDNLRFIHGSNLTLLRSYQILLRHSFDKIVAWGYRKCSQIFETVLLDFEDIINVYFYLDQCNLHWTII